MKKEYTKKSKLKMKKTKLEKLVSYSFNHPFSTAF